MNDIEIKFDFKNLRVFAIFICTLLSLQILTPIRISAHEIEDKSNTPKVVESDQEQTATCDPVKIWFEEDSYDMIRRRTFTAESSKKFKLHFEPENAYQKYVEYSTDDPDIVTAEITGGLTPKKVGETYLYARTYNGLVARTKLVVKELYPNEDEFILEYGKTERTIGKGRRVKVNATVSPSDIMDTFTYETSNDKVASVTKDGLLTGVGLGKTYLTVSTPNNISKKVLINVVKAEAAKSMKLPKYITLHTPEAQEYDSFLNDRMLLNPEFTPAGADQIPKYTSSNPAVVSVDSHGKLSAKKAGTAIITAVSDNGLKATSTVTVIDSIYVEKNLGDWKYLTVGETVKQSFLANVNGREFVEGVTFQSTNPSVVSISKTGVVTAIKEGEAIISGTYAGKKAETKIVVEPSQTITSLSAEYDQTVLLGDTGNFVKVSVEPRSMSFALNYKVSNESILSVDDYGEITAKQVGTTFVYVSSKDGKHKATVKLRVVGSNPSKADYLSFNVNTVSLMMGEKKEVKASVYPITSSATISYSSNNEKVATVDKNGIVTAKMAGKTYINAKSTTGLTAKYLITVTDPKVPANVVLNIENATLSVGNGFQAKATVTPTTATNKKVTWRSSSPAIASVDANGNVKALKAGYTYIIAKTTNGIEEKCLVKVVNVTPKLNIKNATLSIGKGFQAKVTNISSGITWRSSSPAIASVDAKGNVKALKSGSTYIIAKTANGNEVKCLVKVVSIDPTSVSMNISNATLTIGKTFTAKATVYPTNATNKGITFTSSDPKVATVDQSGKVTTVGAGIAEIKATTKNGKVGVIKVKVLPDPESVAITPSSATVKVGAAFKARAIVTPSNANTIGTFKSSSPSVASVDTNGNVKALKEGYTYISVTTANGKIAKFLLHVVK